MFTFVSEYIYIYRNPSVKSFSGSLIDTLPKIFKSTVAVKSVVLYAEQVDLNLC